MKKLLFLFILTLLYSFSQAQNLVPNYSFENYVKCINGCVEFNGYMADWTGQLGAGGLSCFTSKCPDSIPKNNSAGVPYNDLGFQFAHSGVSYVGMQSYVYTDASTGYALKNFRNYIQAKLIDSLKKGVKYYVTFYVSLADSVNYSCNDIGAYLSDSVLNLSGDSVKYYLTPQVANDPIKNPLTDTMNWIKVAGNFMANGGEAYIIIGNFKNDSLSNIKYMGNISSDEGTDYHYIDDIIVSPDSNYADSIFASVQNINTHNETVRVFPNPSNQNFTVQLSGIYNKTNFCLYNNIGELVHCETLKINLTTIATKDLASGIYYYRIEDVNGNLIVADKVVVMH